MKYFLVFLSGVLLACMQSFNGQLSTVIVIYGTSFLVHLIGAILMILYIKVIKKEKGLLREAMKNLLPKEISERKKSPFPKTHHPEYLRILRQELIKISKVDEPLWKIFNKEEILKLCDEESTIPWYGQLMTTPQTIAYLLQINYWIKKYKIQIQ